MLNNQIKNIKKIVAKTIKTTTFLGGALSLVFFAVQPTQNAWAAPPNALQSYNCFSCHAQQQNLMGPSWQAIRSRYQGQANAKDVLSKSIIHGVSGKWGEIPMPSNPQLTQSEADAISQWILSSK